MLTEQNDLIDFNPGLCYFDAPTKGANNEHGQNCFFSSHGVLAALRIPQMRRALSRRLQGQKFFLHGSIFMHGLRPINLSRKPARYRILSSVHAKQTLSYGHSCSSVTQHAFECKQPKRLAYLCRLRASVNSHRSRFIPSRSFWCRIKRYGVRFRCHNHRLMSFVIPLGLFSKEQRSNQTSYTPGLTRQYPVIYRNHRRKSPRSQHIRHAHPRGWVFLHYGSRLSGLQSTLRLASSQRVFCHQSQIKLPVSPSLFTGSQKINRPALRSNSCFNRLSISRRLSGETSARKVFRFRTQPSLNVFTNNFSLEAITIAQLYKSRWQIELFFKWIKQHLRIKAFFGTSENAVKTQVWIAISIYVLVAIIKKRLNLKPS